MPNVYLENYEVVGLDKNNPIKVSYSEDLGQIRATKENARYVSDEDHSSTLINGVGRIGAMIGGEEAHWIDEEFPDVFTGKAMDFIDKNAQNPFFLFFSFHDIHIPRLPNGRFQGKTDMGPRGDAIVQMDWMTGRIMEKLKKKGLTKNTLVIFTSDNGPVLNDGYADFSEEKLGRHKPGGPFSGGKYIALEAGTRVPTIVHWPAQVPPGESDALLSQVDLYRSIAALVDVELGKNEAIDSENQLMAFLGKEKKGRAMMPEESHTFSLRKGHWKYMAPLPENQTIPEWMRAKNITLGLIHEPQLYNLSNDIGEQHNMADEHPEIVNALKKDLEAILDSRD